MAEPTNLDFLTYWIGALTISAVCGAALVAFIAAIYGALVLSFHFWLRRVFKGVVNWNLVRQWHLSGRPEWRLGADRVYRMVPAAGPYEQDSEPVTPTETSGTPKTWGEWEREQQKPDGDQ